MLTDEEKRILLQNRLFAELPAERLDGLLQKLSSRTACFGKNSVIWGMGERIDHAGIVLSGRVEAWRYTQDGQESLSAVHEAGGLFGDVLMSARTVGSPVELRTARPSKILFLSLDALLRCCAEDGGSDCTRLLSNLLEEISEKYWALQRHIRLLSIPDGRTRLEAYLRQEAGNYKYAKSALALVLPILYCVLDALGTFADSKVLETLIKLRDQLQEMKKQFDYLT